MTEPTPITTFQAWINARGANLTVDGVAGVKTRAAILSVFTNLAAPSITPDELLGFSLDLGVSLKQLNAVAQVESSGGGFTAEGRPKILFERHYFWRLTEGRYGLQPWSQPKSGGYDQDSWSKLCLAACSEPAAAFASCSWGKFQVLGAHWNALGYTSPQSLAYTTVHSEADHYALLVRYIKANKLADAMRRLSTDPADCREFARLYNGPRYRNNVYDDKLAAAMV